MTDRDRCDCTEVEILAAIRAIEAQRDAYIRSLSNADRADAGAIGRFQEDIEALKALRILVREQDAVRAWEASQVGEGEGMPPAPSPV
jgi:hypothetical protein